MPATEPKKRVRLTTTIDRELLTAARHLAIDRNQNLNEIIEEAIRRLLKTLKKSA